MADAIYVPRINNNDDEVKLVSMSIVVGGQVKKGQIIAQVETDKAVVDVEASADGFVLALLGEVEGIVMVGSVLVWLGESPEEAVPIAAIEKSVRNTSSLAPTAKAQALLKEHGLDAGLVPASGERLSVADVERYLANRLAVPKNSAAAAKPTEALPETPGVLKVLKSEERGMLATVVWHRDVAVAGYIEMSYDTKAWETYAQEFGQKNGLLLSPLMSLMAWRLVGLAQDNAKLNSTIVGTQRYEYGQINLGSTVQVGDVLYLAVVRDAAALDELGFVTAMVELQRRAAGHKLGPQETQGTTIGFSSMARWKVARHIPILSPQTALMVAHTVGVDGVGVLGASYDHRVMGGSDVALVLRKLSRPAKSA